MKTSAFVFLLSCLCLASAITKYDFNVCRISNCNAQEINCIADQSTCLGHFVTLRTCFDSCGSVDNYGACWSTCRSTAATSNTLYLSLALCYQNVCYLAQKWILVAFALVVFLMIL